MTGAAAAQSAAVSPFDTLAGEVHGTVSSSGRPFLVTADLVIPVGETVVFDTGSTFLFAEFTGIQVHGTLLARGTDQRPIVFTSQNDQRFSMDGSVQAAPYDWNGIVVHEDAVGTTLRHCSVEYSLFGLKSLTPYITVDSCALARNAKSNFSIGGIEQSTATGLYSYHSSPPMTVVTTAAAAARPKPVISVFGQPVRRPALAGPATGAVLAGIVVAVWKGSDYRSSVTMFHMLDQTGDPRNLTSPTIIEDWEKAKARKNRDFALTAAGGALAMLGLIGLTFSF